MLGFAVPQVRLRALRESDLDVISGNQTQDLDPWNVFGFASSNGIHRRFAADGGLSEESGTLAVETTDGELVGSVGWHTVQHGPSPACRALNIGISLFDTARGKGLGSAAQRQLAEHLFATRLVERVEATTDTENVVEQRALRSAGFLLEGTLRHAQFRDGRWRDVVIFSRLRGD
jgi:RimJ/RimL family protein N-acetyltransferase